MAKLTQTDNGSGGERVAQLVECFSSTPKALGSVPFPHKLGIQKVEAGNQKFKCFSITLPFETSMSQKYETLSQKQTKPG